MSAADRQTQLCPTLFTLTQATSETSVDSNGESSADAGGLVWPEDGKRYASSVDDILVIQDDSIEGYKIKFTNLYLKY